MRRALPALLLLTVSIAACGGASARDQVIDAANRTVDQEGLRADVTGAIRMDGAPGSLPVSAMAVVAEGGERTRGTADLSATQGPGMPGGVADIITIGEDIYLRTPGLLPQGTTEEWILFDARLREQTGFGERPGGFGSEDPTEVLAVLADTAGDIEEVGPEDVRGVATTRYRMTVDLSDVEGAAEEGLGEAVPTEVWVGEDGLVRRLRQRLRISDAGQRGEVDFTVEYFDFGVDERIEPPPQDDVISAEEAFGDP